MQEPATRQDERNRRLSAGNNLPRRPERRRAPDAASDVVPSRRNSGLLAASAWLILRHFKMIFGAVKQASPIPVLFVSIQKTKWRAKSARGRPA